MPTLTALVPLPSLTLAMHVSRRIELTQPNAREESVPLGICVLDHRAVCPLRMLDEHTAVRESDRHAADVGTGGAGDPLPIEIIRPYRTNRLLRHVVTHSTPSFLTRARISNDAYLPSRKRDGLGTTGDLSLRQRTWRRSESLPAISG